MLSQDLSEIMAIHERSDGRSKKSGNHMGSAGRGVEGSIDSCTKSNDRRSTIKHVKIADESVRVASASERLGSMKSSRNFE